MTLVRTLIGVALSCAVVLAGCGDDAMGGKPVNRLEQDSGAPPMSCEERDDCAPSDFEPGMRKPFAACGGDATGAWLMTEVDFSGFEFAFTLNGEDVGACATDVEDDGLEPPYHLLSLAPGGRLEMATARFEVPFRLLQSCIRERVGAGVGCADIGCTQDGPEMCACTTGNTGGSVEGRWSPSATTLRFTEDATSVSILYCVTGERMELVFPSGIRQVFAAKGLIDQPLACAERTEALCERGTGCQLTGSSCSGEAEACAIDDYGAVPGCELTDGPVGTLALGERCAEPYECQSGVCSANDADAVLRCRVRCGEQGCAANELCEDRVCVPGSCTPNASFCVGDTYYACDVSASERTLVETCSDFDFCADGLGCTADVCEPGRPVCEGDVLTTCKADGSGGELGGIDCAAAGGECTVDLGCGATAVDDVPEGSTEVYESETGLLVGNVYRVDRTVRVRELVIGVSAYNTGEVLTPTYYVYSSSTLDGPFTRIAQGPFVGDTTDLQTHELEAGTYYLIAVFIHTDEWGPLLTERVDAPALPIATSFGQLERGFRKADYSEATETTSASHPVYRQTLTTFGDASE